VQRSILILIFNPKIVVADFEQAIHFAAKQVWPSIILVGCRFHLSQDWWRNIQSCGLQTEYKDPNSEIGKWLYLIFGLSLFHAKKWRMCL